MVFSLVLDFLTQCTTHFKIRNMPRRHNANIIKFRGHNDLGLYIDMEEEELANRIKIRFWVWEHYGEDIGHKYPIWFMDKFGTWVQIEEDYSLKDAFEIARDQLDRAHVVYVRVWPRCGLELKTELKTECEDEKKVFDKL